MVGGPGQGVERQHRAADDVEVHLHVEAFVEELNLQGAPEPECGERVLHLSRRLAEHRRDGQDQAQERSAGEGIDGGTVEPIARQQTAGLERPYRYGEQEHQDAVKPIVARPAGLGVDDVARNPSAGQNELRQEEGGEDGQRGEKPGYGFGCGKLEEVADA